MRGSSAFDFSETKGKNALLIIYYPLTDSQFDFVDILLVDLKLETQIENSDEGAEMFVIVLFGKAMSKHSESDEQRPHRPSRRRKG